MRGYPHFSVWIPETLAKIYFFPYSHNLCKSTSVLGGTVLKVKVVAKIVFLVLYLLSLPFFLLSRYHIPFFLDNMGPIFSEWSVNAHEARPGHHTQASLNFHDSKYYLIQKAEICLI